MPLSESVKQIIAEAEDAEKSVQNAAALLEMVQVAQDTYTQEAEGSDGKLHEGTQTYAQLATAQALGLIAMELALARKAKTP